MTTRSKKTTRVTEVRSASRQSTGSRGSPSATAASTTLDMSSSQTTGTESSMFGERIGANSPLSPAFRSRLGEKEALKHLNNRLAQYIERVRTLEEQNASLEYQLRELEEVEQRDTAGMKAAYEKELADTRRALDDLAKRRAELQIECDKAKTAAVNYKDKYDDLAGRVADAERAALSAQSLVSDLQSRVTRVENQCKKAEGEAQFNPRYLVQKYKDLADQLQRQLDAAHKQLEEETLARVEAENKVQTLKEQLQFEKQLHEQDVHEIKQRRQLEIRATKKEAEAETHKLRIELDNLREQLNFAQQAARREMDEMYAQKLRDSESYAERSRESADAMRMELSTWRSRAEAAERSGSGYQAEIDGLKRKVKDLEDELRGLHSAYAERLRSKDEEVLELRRQNDQILDDYKDLWELKVTLEAEIEAYRKLLEGEEHRLNMTYEPEKITDASSMSFSASSRKRRRMDASSLVSSLAARRGGSDFEAHAFSTRDWSNGPIEIEDHETSGAYVRIRNHSDKDVSVGGYHVMRIASAVNEEVGFKLPSRAKIAAGQTLTIWSANQNREHNPPADYVMKDGRSWPHGDKQKTWIMNAEGEEVAWRSSERSNDPMQRGGEFADGVEGDQRCSIM